MAGILIAGDAMVITSSQKLEDIKTLEKYMPKALSLYETDEDGKRKEVFKVGSTEGRGDINQFGASFGSASHDENGYATITMCIPPDVIDAVAYASEKVGYAVVKLNQVEEQFAQALEAVQAQREQVLQNITVA